MAAKPSNRDCSFKTLATLILFIAPHKIKVANVFFEGGQIGGSLATEILIRYTDNTVELLAHQLVFAPYEIGISRGFPLKRRAK